MGELELKDEPESLPSEKPQAEAAVGGHLWRRFYFVSPGRSRENAPLCSFFGLVKHYASVLS